MGAPKIELDNRPRCRYTNAVLTSPESIARGYCGSCAKKIKSGRVNNIVLISPEPISEEVEIVESDSCLDTAPEYDDHTEKLVELFSSGLPVDKINSRLGVEAISIKSDGTIDIDSEALEKIKNFESKIDSLDRSLQLSKEQKEAYAKWKRKQNKRFEKATGKNLSTAPEPLKKAMKVLKWAVCFSFGVLALQYFNIDFDFSKLLTTQEGIGLSAFGLLGLSAKLAFSG